MEVRLSAPGRLWLCLEETGCCPVACVPRIVCCDGSCGGRRVWLLMHAGGPSCPRCASGRDCMHRQSLCSQGLPREQLVAAEAYHYHRVLSCIML